MKKWARLCFEVAWRLPPRIVYHAFARVAGHALTNKHRNQYLATLDVDTAITRWKKDKKL